MSFKVIRGYGAKLARGIHQLLSSAGHRVPARVDCSQTTAQHKSLASLQIEEQMASERTANTKRSQHLLLEHFGLMRLNAQPAKKDELRMLEEMVLWLP